MRRLILSDKDRELNQVSRGSSTTNGTAIAMVEQMNAAVLVISDECYRDNSKDKVIPLFKDIFAQQDIQRNFSLTDSAIVDDDRDRIQAIISRWTHDEDKDIRLILTSGGTGFSLRDITPEAVGEMIERSAPGIVHAMLAASFKVTPFAMMGRPVAGVIDKSLIVTLPGSPKAVQENLQAIIHVIPHACEQIAGENSRKLHRLGVKGLEDKFQVSNNANSNDHGNSGCSHHGHQGPTRHDIPTSVVQRKRESPFPMISVNDAYDRIFDNLPSSVPVLLPVGPGLVGRVFAQDVYAQQQIPRHPTSIVDGYAVVSTDGPGVYNVVSISHADGSGPQPTSLSSFSQPADSKNGNINNNDNQDSSVVSIQPGQVARITTGAYLPRGTDAVVMVEETEVAEITSDGQEEKRVKIHALGVRQGDNVREPGSDIAQGAKVLSRGSLITPVGGEIGLLASVGLSHVKVYKKPKVAVISTGNELRDLDQQENQQGALLSGAEIYDSNRPTLLAQISSWGFEAIDMGIALDNMNEVRNTLRRALEKCDVVVTSGGVSMGELDLLKPTIQNELGGEILFGRLAMKPGKPTTVATVEMNGSTKIIFALPGNPVSAAVTSQLFVLPALRAMSGYTRQASKLSRIEIVIDCDFKLDPRPEFHRVCVAFSASRHCFIATSTGAQRSSRIISMEHANGLLCLPGRADRPDGIVHKGETLDVLLIGQITNCP